MSLYPPGCHPCDSVIWYSCLISSVWTLHASHRCTAQVTAFLSTVWNSLLCWCAGEPMLDILQTLCKTSGRYLVEICPMNLVTKIRLWEWVIRPSCRSNARLIADFWKPVQIRFVSRISLISLRTSSTTSLPPPPPPPPPPPRPKKNILSKLWRHLNDCNVSVRIFSNGCCCCCCRIAGDGIIPERLTCRNYNFSWKRKCWSGERKTSGS